MILKSHDLDKWVAKYFVSKMKHIEILKKRRKDTEKCTIQYLFSMSVSFPYHFSIFSVSEFFIGQIPHDPFHCLAGLARKLFEHLFKRELEPSGLNALHNAW